MKRSAVMTLRKNGFVIKTAYFFTYPDNVPPRFELPRIFWRFLGMFFLGIPVGFLIAHTLLAISVLLSSVVGFFIGKRICSAIPYPGEIVCPMKDFPLPEVAGTRVWPITVVTCLGLLWVLLKIPSGMRAVSEFLKENSNYLLLSVLAACLVILIIFAFGGVRRFSKSEAWEMTKSFFKAKKERVCPTIEVVD
jgi:hypothetical protein